MLQKLNYTKRVDLPLDCLNAQITISNDVFLLNLEWNLSSYKFDPNAEIWIEVKTAGSYDYQRYLLGKVANGIGKESINITSTIDPISSRLRYKVVQNKLGKRLIIGNLDNFIPRTPVSEADSKSILKIKRDSSLNVPWIVQYTDGEPLLVISGKEDVYSILRDPKSTFEFSILAEVVRQIFIWRAEDRELINEKISEAWKSFFVSQGAEDDIFDSDILYADLDDRKQNVLDMAIIVSGNFAANHELNKAIRLLTNSMVDDQ